MSNLFSTYLLTDKTNSPHSKYPPPVAPGPPAPAVPMDTSTTKSRDRSASLTSQHSPSNYANETADSEITYRQIDERPVQETVTNKSSLCVVY